MSSRQILIAEDEAILAGDLHDMLENLGYAVAGIASRGEDAIRLAAELRPDLVLMDIRLAGHMDGVTAAGYIQLQAGPPVIFLTAHADEETLARARVTEPYGYLHKPVQERDLRTAIEMALYKHRCDRHVLVSEERHRTTLNSIGEGVISVDYYGRVALMNPEAERITGWTQEEAVGEPLAKILPLTEMGSGRPVPCPAAEALARQSVVKFPPNTVLIARDGRQIPIEDEAAPIDDAGMGGLAGAVITFRDVTEVRRAEAEMLQTQKLESLGVLAAGIAHDFNNLLTPMVGYADLLIAKLAHDQEGVEMVEAIHAAARDAAHLTQQLLAYAGRGKFVAVPIDLSALVREMMILVRANASRKAEFHLDLTAKSAVTQADSAQIRQVVLNLLTNASEALGDAGGTVNIRTRVVHATQEDLQSPFIPNPPAPGEFVVLEVSDSGFGMTGEVLGQIFDPFFTTKFHGRGLGLSAVLGIVRLHGGTLKVHSKPGEGTTFLVYLPRANEPEVLASAPARKEEPSPGGTILLVDDDPTVRALSDRLLRKAGMSTILAKDGRDAVEKYQQRQAEIDAVLLDVTMPRMSGLEALTELRRINPHVRVALMSGYSKEDVAGMVEGETSVSILQKPFSPERLISMIRNVLAGIEVV